MRNPIRSWYVIEILFYILYFIIFLFPGLFISRSTFGLYVPTGSPMIRLVILHWSLLFKNLRSQDCMRIVMSTISSSTGSAPSFLVYSLGIVPLSFFPLSFFLSFFLFFLFFLTPYSPRRVNYLCHPSTGGLLLEIKNWSKEWFFTSNNDFSPPVAHGWSLVSQPQQPFHFNLAPPTLRD